MLRGLRHRRRRKADHGVSIPPRKCSGDYDLTGIIITPLKFQFPRENAQGTTIEVHRLYDDDGFNSPEKMLRGLPRNEERIKNSLCFNSPEKMLRGLPINNDRPGMVSRFNSPEKMLRGLQFMEHESFRILVSIPPRKCSGDYLLISAQKGKPFSMPIKNILFFFPFFNEHNPGKSAYSQQIFRIIRQNP